MSTLLLRLAAPLQSWGVSSKFDTRDTSREPTKSGVIGLLAAALGRDRTDDLNDLRRLKFGVRIDQPGILLRDYHTARSSSQQNNTTSFVTNRYYLADAVFIVALEGEDWFLKELAHALKNPVFPLFLGRRSCPPEGQLVIALRDKPLCKALEEEPWQASYWFQKKYPKQTKLTIVCDSQPKDKRSFLRRDLPISFDQQHRQYGFRSVIDTVEAVPTENLQLTKELPTDHDAMEGWDD